MHNVFDDSVMLAITSFAASVPYFVTQMMLAIVDNPLLKGAPFVCLICWFWFRKGDERSVQNTREHLVSTSAGALAALVVARVLAALLPFRSRPQFDPGLHFNPRGVAHHSSFVDWSSFPSDHAVFFAALAIGLGFVSRTVGVLSFVYALVFIGLPRIFLGIHYPTDVIAGGLLGGIIGYGFNMEALRQLLSAPALRWERTYASLFYVIFVMFAFEITTMFDSLRELGGDASRLLKALVAMN